MPLPTNLYSAFILITFFGIFLSEVSNANEKNLVSRGDKVAAKQAYVLAQKLKWVTYQKVRNRVQNPILKKALLWYRLKSPNSGSNFGQIDGFMTNNSDWPQKKLMQIRAEQVMPPTMSDIEVLKWFKHQNPLTPNGTTRLAASLLKSGKKSHAIKLIQNIWINGNFGAKQEAQFYRQFRQYMTRENHIERLERLLWEGKYYPVRRMYRRINSKYRALAEARLSLRRMLGGVDRAIERVSPKLKNNVGLIYERLRWRRKKGKNKFAQELLQSTPEDLVHPSLWWRERNILARRSLKHGDISEAYLLVKNHGLGMTYRSGYIEAEWLAGWIALQFLEEKTLAFQHFQAGYRASNFPISKSRFAYWAGRATELRGKINEAQKWYELAFKQQSTFYGQLAANRLNSEEALTHFVGKNFDNSEAVQFNNHKFVTVARILGEAGMKDMLRPFIRHLNKHGTTKKWRMLVAKLSSSLGRPDLAILTAKKSLQAGLNLMELGYPILMYKIKKDVESSLIHAIIRQESEFNQRAVSNAGAMGLMQILPRTAAHLAKKYSLPYLRADLTRKREYNLNLGQFYIRELLEQFSNSYILTLAAYNAGPTRVRRWIKSNGDPREADIDPIDWIEKIPYRETRNYVQRVIENLHVYRHLIKTDNIQFNPENELRR